SDSRTRSASGSGASFAMGRGERPVSACGCHAGKSRTISARKFAIAGPIEAIPEMSRTAQDVLEFDKLRELLRLRTTCAPGRRCVDALAFTTDRAALGVGFAQIREAREWLRAER